MKHVLLVNPFECFCIWNAASYTNECEWDLTVGRGEWQLRLKIFIGV